jgi:hypothetical protein
MIKTPHQLEYGRVLTMVSCRRRGAWCTCDHHKQQCKTVVLTRIPMLLIRKPSALSWARFLINWNWNCDNINNRMMTTNGHFVNSMNKPAYACFWTWIHVWLCDALSSVTLCFSNAKNLALIICWCVHAPKLTYVYVFTQKLCCTCVHWVMWMERPCIVGTKSHVVACEWYASHLQHTEFNQLNKLNACCSLVVEHAI